MVAALEATGLHLIMEYIRRRQVTIAENVACRPIYELCIEIERRPGTTLRRRHDYCEHSATASRARPLMCQVSDASAVISIRHSALTVISDLIWLTVSDLI